ncbi:MAG TPA: hypothetical protein VN317_02530 [Candidatus Methanoperedens sp.]|nr:hypothetical protein [Candidatus Methanoperedens sp.]
MKPSPSPLRLHPAWGPERRFHGKLEGHVLTGRHGFSSSYEAFVHIIDSMFNQHAKWLDHCNRPSWRAAVASLKLLITSTVWRQDRNGFTHQNPSSSTWLSTRAPR